MLKTLYASSLSLEEKNLYRMKIQSDEYLLLKTNKQMKNNINSNFKTACSEATPQQWLLCEPQDRSILENQEEQYMQS